jgi:hypothetical protein
MISQNSPGFRGLFSAVGRLVHCHERRQPRAIWSVFKDTFLLYQCCRSGSGIRCLFDPWIRVPGWVKNQDPDPGWTIFPRAWKHIFGLKYFNSLMRIRDPGWKKFGSGIWDKLPGSATLYSTIDAYVIDCLTTCPALNAPNGALEEGEEHVIETAGCCPHWKKVCHQERCAPPPACPAHLVRTVNTSSLHNCCTKYTCGKGNLHSCEIQSCTLGSASLLS